MSIEVHVRLRPGVSHPVWASAETVLYSTTNPNTRYVYNKVHPSTSANQTVFQGIEALVHAAFDGKNTTVMAYGQTGSGKTHSMIGTENDAGIVPRTARLLLELKRIHPGTVIRAYYTEIYNEGVRDLLEPQRGDLALHDAPDGGVTFDTRMVQVEGFEDFLRLQDAAERNRKYGVTNLNDHSSRSHIILTLEIHRAHRGQKSVINLVDLAGSESAARANTEGMTLREGGFINCSLLTLGNVVDAIVEKRPYVPYRDAKLTRILLPCLGGSGITFILCCVNPGRENYEQTITALRFTQRAMKIKNDPVVVLQMPPLFTHQYGESAQQLLAGTQECAEAEYQRGLRDAYTFGNNTTAAIVGNFQSQVENSLHALANAQRLLIAHDHAQAMGRVGRLYNQLSDLSRQKARQAELTEGEKKRQRDVATEMSGRRAKLSRLEAELAEKEAAADTDIAGWEYQLLEARRRQVSEMDLLLRTEETRRARIVYEWAVCMERVSTRYVPSLVKLMNSADAMISDSGGISMSGSVSKAVALVELREQLTTARAELADLELAHDMIRDDVEQLRRAGGNDGTFAPAAATVATASDKATDDLTDAELAAEIALLEHEERQLRAQARREIRRESIRQVRESLRRSSRSPQAASSRTDTPQPVTLINSGNEDGGPRSRAEKSSSSAAAASGAHRRLDKSVSNSANHAATAKAGGSGTATLRRSRSTSGLRQSPHTGTRVTLSRDSYADGVRNALSVLDGLKSRLGRPRSKSHSSTRAMTPPAATRHQDPLDQPGRGRPLRKSRRCYDGEGAEEGDALGVACGEGDRGGEDSERTFWELYGMGATQSVRSPDKENYLGKHRRPEQMQAHVMNKRGRPPARAPTVMDVVEEDDEAFATAADTVSDCRQPPSSPGHVTPPTVGIAARRKWDRQTQSREHQRQQQRQPSPKPREAAVERTLYLLHTNSHSPSMERDSRARDRY